jgi:hypothetical protein
MGTPKALAIVVVAPPETRVAAVGCEGRWSAWGQGSSIGDIGHTRARLASIPVTHDIL